MNISKKIEKVEKGISKYIYKLLKLPKAIKRFVKIEYSTYHKEIRVFYNDKYIGKVDSDNDSFLYSTGELVENIIKNYASKLALSSLGE
jgi:hypothetical protein